MRILTNLLCRPITALLTCLYISYLFDMYWILPYRQLTFEPNATIFRGVQ